MDSRLLLPHQSTGIFLTDGGLETTLVFLEGFDLPYFAAFDILKSSEGFTAIQNYYRRYLSIAKTMRSGFILETPTWRANPDWIEKIGYPGDAVTEINRKAVQLMVELKNEYAAEIEPIIISGCVGPRGDGYKPGHTMTPEQAQRYHSAQIDVLGRASVDIISAITINYVEEAIGIARAAAGMDIPSVISFTVETDGKLPTGMTLQEAIEQVDSRADTPPIYYMINCAHPSHFAGQFTGNLNEQWMKRIRGVRANASCKSHAELDEATSLDRGNPSELGTHYRQLKQQLPHLNVFGGCCGTDEEHVMEIAKQVITQ